MHKLVKASFGLFAASFCLFLFTSTASANNLTISNVSLESRTPSSTKVVVEFDVAWENAWKTKINHDAVWLTVRLYNPSVSPTNKRLCTLVTSGLNPSDVSAGSDSDLEFYVPADKRGAFLRLSSYITKNSVSSEDVQLTIDYSSCGFAGTDNVRVSILGVEMTYVPEGAFYAGDDNTSTAALVEGSADSDPWYIASGSSISVSNPSSDGYRYVSGGNTGESSSGSSFTIPSTFPNGYGAFYAMKYPVTEGQWVEFINSLPSAAARANRDLTDTAHKNTDTVLYRNTISCSGSPLTCSSARPARALNYMTWMDLAAFLDWAALRPMTELEYEKMGRGPILPIEGEFAWGSTTITAATTISSGDEDGDEVITTTGANAHYNNVTLSGGDTTNGVDYQQGPLRVGIFATGSSTRETAGAGYYGTMGLSGNLSERVVTIGNATGRNFSASHGDGVLTTTSGYEGNATSADWPGIDGTPSRGITGALGSGFRGGSWSDASSGARLRLSDRAQAAKSDTAAYNNAGGRGVRTDDSQ